MQKIFDTLINSFIDTKIGITENFLTDELAGHLRIHLAGLLEDNYFLAAGTGNGNEQVLDKLFRSDVIYWLDRKHNNRFENEFLALIDLFIAYLNSTCYTGITGCEFHFAVYGKGAFYKKHLDQFRNDQSRQYSMIIYLNNLWEVADGGQLRIHQEGNTFDISPTSGKSVFFKSNELEHEVLLTNKPRLSITGWLKISDD
ncbi:2OG-Fe(II) oxygenase [Flavitalea flava]